MKLQHLAIIFVIIILPIALVVGEYIQMQIDTITLQKAYSSKLQTATYDSMKAFTLNTINNKYSTVSNSKIRDIEASISTFYTSLGNEINVLANTPDKELKQYTPAILYTMYDGYYIYSKYYNETDSEYQYGLKPYIYYTCRYKKGKIDIIVNYTLDNYVTIYGNIGENYITKSGNIINPKMVNDVKWDGNGNLLSLKYGPIGNSITIGREILTENICYIDNNNILKENMNYSYTMYNGNKVYYDGAKYFTLNKSRQQDIVGKQEIAELKKYTVDGKLYSDSALKYYYEAYLFSNWAKQYLGEITQDDAVDENGNQITDFTVNTGTDKIFSYSGDLDVTGSCFDLNRIAVIRRSIQTNLMTAIANYNRVSTNTYNYVLPVLSEEDWDNVTNNISIISFMQGIPIGAKYFNDYCVITNNMNEEFVSLNSLYAITDDNEVHLINCKDILDKGIKVNKVYKNIDFERQTMVISEGSERYYYPHYETKSYSCLVNVAETYDIDYVSGKVNKYDVKTDKYIEKKDVNLSALHYLRSEVLHAYGRESYDLYKVNDYFRGYDESISTDSITQEKTDNLEIHVTWDASRHQALVFAYKVAGVQDSLKIQYLRNPTNLQISNNDEWITVNEGALPEYFNLHDRIYLRLYDGTYDGDYVIVIIRDTLPPGVPTIEVTGNKGNSEYYVSEKVKVKITAGIDAQSGFKSLVYTVKQNGNVIKNIEIGDEVVEFEIPEDGMITIEAQTKDKADNLSEIAFYGLNKDSLPPYEPIIEVIGENKADYYYDEVKVKFKHGQDREPKYSSGIKTLYYTIENIEGTNVDTIYGTAYDGEIITIPPTMQGVVKISAYMEDNAGNKSGVVTKTISKDNIKPQITTALYSSDVTTNSFKLNIVVKDENSGIEKIVWHYKNNSTDKNYKNIVTDCERQRTEIQKSVPIENLISGTYTAYAEVYDVAGNITTSNYITVIIDPIKDPISASATPTGWTNQDVTVTLPQEGYTTQYQLNGINGTWNAYTGPFKVSSNATVYYRYSDGTNKSVYKTITISNIDKKLTEITVNLSSSAVTSKGFTLSIKVKDENSGLGKIVWNYRLKEISNYTSEETIYTPLNGEPPGERGEVTKTKILDNLKNGTYKVYADVYDVAGNVKKSNEIEIILTGIEKASGATISPAGWTNGNVIVTLPTKTGYTTKYQTDTTAGLWKNYTEKLTISNNNTTVYYLYSDGTNNGSYSSITVDKIEREKPEIITQISSSNITKTSFDLSVKVKDITSGLGKIVWKYKLDGQTNYQEKVSTYKDLHSTERGSVTGEIKTFKITVSTVGTYKVYAEIYDVAGNMIETTKIDVKMHTHDESCKHYHTGNEKDGGGCYGGQTTHKHNDSCSVEKYWFCTVDNCCEGWGVLTYLNCPHGHGNKFGYSDTRLNCKRTIDYSLNCKYKDYASGEANECGYE